VIQIRGNPLASSQARKKDKRKTSRSEITSYHSRKTFDKSGEPGSGVIRMEYGYHYRNARLFGVLIFKDTI
jgi:hypothetical protein